MHIELHHLKGQQNPMAPPQPKILYLACKIKKVENEVLYRSEGEKCNLGHCARLNLIQCIAENNAISQAKPEFLLGRLFCKVLCAHYPNYSSQPVGCFIPSYCCISQIKRSTNSDDPDYANTKLLTRKSQVFHQNTLC